MHLCLNLDSNLNFKIEAKHNFHFRKIEKTFKRPNGIDRMWHEGNYMKTEQNFQNCFNGSDIKRKDHIKKGNKDDWNNIEAKEL